MLSQTAEYALRAMAWLAVTPDELVAASELSIRTKVPTPYLAKVLQSLASAELISGRRGVGGGYTLAKPADDISLLDVINAVSPIQRITSCPLGLENHDAHLCALHRKADEAAKAVIDIFSGTSLLELLAQTESNKPLCDTRTTAILTVKNASSESTTN